MTHETSKAFVDYYQLLGIQPDALNEDIRTAFVRLAKLQHPDTGGSLEDMQDLNKAYSTLRDGTSRKAYDLIHQFHTGTSTVVYRESALDDKSGSSIASLADDEIDDFVNSVFAEYAAKPPKEPFHKKAASALRFRRRKT
ncbi:MAG: J domain-containing protein [Candidatus Saccharimonadales bacterium]|nr:J domain-containing protein [Candidatus Saccharibacteria bacterium]